MTGAIGFDAAARAVDVRTLVLLFSMMIIVAHLRLAGGLAVAAQFVAARVAHPAALMMVLMGASAVLSALFVNDTICLVFTPLVLDIVAERRLRPLPFLLALATSSNIGSVATITGNPQNILVGSLSGLSFGRFAAVLGPVAVIALAIDALILWIIFRADLQPVTSLTPPRNRTIHLHAGLLWKTVIVMSGVLAGFLAGVDTALVAASGAAVLLVTRRVRPRKVYAAIDWDLLMLFVGLFVIVAAGERAGINRRLFEWLAPLGVTTIAGLSATAAVVANAVSNVPAVMLFTRIVPRLPDPATSWLALAMSSTLSGNLTILGFDCEPHRRRRRTPARHPHRLRRVRTRRCTHHDPDDGGRRVVAVAAAILTAMRVVTVLLLSCALFASAPIEAQTRRAPARRPAPTPPTVEAPEMRCPTPLGVGMNTKRSYCDVLTGRDPAAGIVIALPPHRGDVTLTFDLHNRHTYSEEQMKDKRAAFARYTAVIGALTSDNTLISRAVVQSEFRSAKDLVERIGGGAGPAGMKAVAPTGTESITIVVPEAENEVSILGEKLIVERADGAVTYSSEGRPIAIISNVMISYRPAPPKPAPKPKAPAPKRPGR
ncbi:MAG: SLC13 family permease [Vicinamibacterales bacterium]